MTALLTRHEGALPFQTIADMLRAGCVMNAQEKNIRPASLDLTVSEEVFEVEGIFQPKMGESVRDVLKVVGAKKFSLGRALVPGKMYIARLNETLALPRAVYASCNPKSTSGRVDVHVRLIADGVSRYDILPAGFEGELWISIVPKTFSIKLYAGVSLNQLRFFNRDTRLNDLEIELAMREHKLLWRPKNGAAYKPDEIRISDGDGSVILTLELADKMLGFEGIPSKEVVDLAKVGVYSPAKFFKTLKKRGDYLYLKKNSFYILSTHEAVRVPPELACEMVPMDERSGEFRSHYAGFIDPGWGWGKAGEEKGRPLTLEVRPFEDLIVRQGQPIAKIRFERMSALPDVVYDATGSHYSKQSGPKLAKHFK